MIDIGANLTNAAFKDDLGPVLARAQEAGIEAIIVTGSDADSSLAAAELAAAHPGLLASTAGVHPHDAKDAGPDWLERIEALLRRPEVKAVGETGLDFNRNYSPADVQIAVFDAQLELAARLAIPAFIHDRDSGGAVLERLTASGLPPERVVVHCFTGDAQELDDYLCAGYHIGITGWVCDERRGLGLRELVSRIPDDQLLIETDAPYLMPRTITPKPPSRRNEPANLVWVAQTVATARAVSLDHVIEFTTRNARRFFGL